jgi:hypothetical protein
LFNVYGQIDGTILKDALQGWERVWKGTGRQCFEI